LAGSFCSVQLMGPTVQTFRKTAVFAARFIALALFAVAAWSHEDSEHRDRETREDRSGRDVGTDNSGSGSSRSGSDDVRREDRHDRAERRGSSTRFEVERDTAGRERVRREVLMVADQQSIDTVRDAGFTIIAERPLTAFAETLARIRVRRGRSVEQTISELQALAPLASIAPDHLFRPSGDEVVATTAETTPAPVAAINTGHVGVIDTGADVSWPAITHSIVRTVARSGARLTVADVFGVDADNRLIAPAAAIASAIDWLVAGGVRVINISIEGPDNFVLAHVIKRALAVDVAIVAAAGNGGPGAAPAFPAAYPGVIAVTAVDENGQVYRRANRGDYIAFAARGVHVESEYEAATSKAKTVSGTSFASPIVAAAIARRLDGSAGLESVIDSLKSEARDLGAPGRDAIYGWGELDIPQTLTASSR